MGRQTTTTENRDPEVRAIIRHEIAAAVPTIKAALERGLLSQRHRRAF